MMITFKPRKTKYRHSMKRLRHIRGKASRNNKCVLDNSVAIVADKGFWIKDFQLEAIRLFIARKMNKLKCSTFHLLFRVFPHRSCAKRKPEVPMGGGKSDFFCYVAELKKGTIIFELTCPDKDILLQVIRAVKYIIPSKSIIRYNLSKKISK